MQAAWLHRGVGVAWFERLTTVVNFGSFSSVWYWIALAVMWSTAAHWVLGIPFDMVSRARAMGGAAQAELDVLGRIMAARLANIARVSGTVSVALGSFALSALAVLGFGYGVQLAQALFCLFFPMALVGVKSAKTAQYVHENALQGADLAQALARLRLWVQVIGMVSIFLTAIWGMYQNMRYSMQNHSSLFEVGQQQENNG